MKIFYWMFCVTSLFINLFKFVDCKHPLKLVNKIIFTLSIVLVITSCRFQVTQLKSGAEKVVLTEGVPESCRLIGEIQSESHGGSTHKLLDQSQLNDLRNQAFDLNANVVLVKSDLTLYTGTNNADSATDHQIEGEAFSCEQKDIKILVNYPNY